MRVWVAAGGTGGHLYPALAVVDRITALFPETQVRFAVSRRGLEARVLTEFGHPFTELMTQGLHRREITRNLLFPYRTIGGLVQSVRAIRRFRPDVAFGTGGFVSGPALLAAWLMRVPVVLLALDVLPGVTIRVLAPFARLIFVTHPQAQSVLSGRRNVQVVGTPIRAVESVAPGFARQELGIPERGPVLFVTGGSQGSLALNRAVGEALPQLMQIPELTLLWQTGADHLDSARASRDKALEQQQVDPARIRIVPYIDAMNIAWSAADLALCRAGASTLAELQNYGVPALLVPLASAAGAHQEANSRAMEAAGAARMIPEETLNGRYLTIVVSSLISDRELDIMAAATTSMAHSGAASRVAEGLVETARDLEESKRTEMLEAFREGQL
jgi:UDP-N-acetylglucosamine--N-acetylmuramyl-(pentapeptide) pyrophosphoryl-undecaprenol N-acetylglucosamine transferase